MAKLKSKTLDTPAIVPLRWNSASHPISDIRDWASTNQLELQPDYQRREVWSDVARIALMDTIIRNIPMPKIYLQSTIRDKKTFRSVVDGQQRISSILKYLGDEFVLDLTCPEGYANRKFSQLSSANQDLILGYKIDVNEIVNATDPQVREIYSRVNKYTKNLSKQELRRADYPGDFLDVSEKLALAKYFESSQVFSAGDRRRMGDVEFVSELLVAILRGPQNKKRSLDQYYQTLASWPQKECDAVVEEFNEVLSDLERIFPETHPIHATRFVQKSDFYSLFLAILLEHRAGGTLRGKNLDLLRADLLVVEKFIAPTSDVKLLAEYAVHCVSDANSEASRAWRTNFTRALLQGTFHSRPRSVERYELLCQLFGQLVTEHSGMCRDTTWECPYCEVEVEGFSYKEHRIAWALESEVQQIENAIAVHRRCKHTKSAPRLR